MCKEPILIKNPTKYITKGTGQRMYLYVNCGKCSECRAAKQQEWNLRTFYQMLDCIKKGGWMYFDTLTYDNKNLPRLTNYIESNQNWACFDYRHIRQFYENLRGYYKGKDRNIIYFITSEYGTLRNRPHYHIILFVYMDCDRYELSKNVAKAWNKGRTDGLPYKTKKYVTEHNIITKVNLDAVRYVAKYVTKSQHFTEIINRRWANLQKWYERSKYNKLQIKRIKAKYYRYCSPFHRQSQHFGENALEYFDLGYIFENNVLYYKSDTLKINQYCALPMYFKRKLFKTQITYKGKKMWVTNDLGTQYEDYREPIIIDKLADRLKDADFNKKYTGKYKDIATYIIKERGRLNGEDDHRTHHEEAELYNYNTDKDLKYLGHKVISKQFAGNDKTGYITTDIIPTDENIFDCAYNNQEYEEIINDLTTHTDDKTLVLLKERLAEIKKIYF